MLLLGIKFVNNHFIISIHIYNVKVLRNQIGYLLFEAFAIELSDAYLHTRLYLRHMISSGPQIP